MTNNTWLHKLSAALLMAALLALPATASADQRQEPFAALSGAVYHGQGGNVGA